jgi:uncharacterized protein (DUF305 family)
MRYPDAHGRADEATRPAHEEKSSRQTFLKDMIQHHRRADGGGICRLHGAAQDDLVQVPSDVNIDQTTEIARMEKMLKVMINFGDEQH